MKKKVFLVLLLLMVIILFGCGKKANPASDFEYTVMEDDTIEITKYIGDETDVVIPRKIEGKEVSIIGSAAFGGSNIKTLDMPDTVILLESAAFVDCATLTDIQCSRSLITIRSFAFAGCTSLVEVDLSMRALRFIDEYAFSNCENIRKINFGDNIEQIKKEAFRNCMSLEEVILPQKLKEIGDCAFGDCINVKKIWVPKTLEKWGMSPFTGNTSVAEIVFEDGLKRIGEYGGAFAGCQVEVLRIPASVEEITSIAFTAFPKLKEVYFEGNAPIVGTLVFATPEQGVKIYYDPSAFGWETTPLRNENVVLPLDID